MVIGISRRHSSHFHGGCFARRLILWLGSLELPFGFQFLAHFASLEGVLDPGSLFAVMGAKIPLGTFDFFLVWLPILWSFILPSKFGVLLGGLVLLVLLSLLEMDLKP
jgi:hypothetical protein